MIIAYLIKFAKIVNMKPLFEFKDDQYEFTGISHERNIVRAILLDENDNICLEKIVDNDMFGPRDYYETPGGGIKAGETHKTALNRELSEEVGYECEIIKFLGQVDDYYNLIKRFNHNFYYLARRTKKVDQKLEPDEKIRIEKIIWVSIDEAIKNYENMQNVLVGKLVKQRELPILKLAKTALQSKNK